MKEAHPDTKTDLQSWLDPRLDVCIMFLSEKTSTNGTAERVSPPPARCPSVTMTL